MVPPLLLYKYSTNLIEDMPSFSLVILMIKMTSSPKIFGE
jgi:hypothetical protein